MKDTKIINGKLERFGKVWNYTEVALTEDFNRKKPVIDEAKVLDAEEKSVVEHTLKMEGRKLISIFLRPTKNDYKHDFDRGTVAWSFDCYNYSYHKVVIPDGTVIEDRNFAQLKPHTKAVTGKNLIFKECNLVNNEIDPTWVLENCNICQIKRVIKSQKNTDTQTTLVISHQVEQKDGTFKEVQVYEKVHNLGDEYNIKKMKYEVA